MLGLFRRLKPKAQGMTEYIIIVAMIAIAAILVVKIFGKNIRMIFKGASDSMKAGKVVAPKDMQDYQDTSIDKYYYDTTTEGGK